MLSGISIRAPSLAVVVASACIGCASSPPSRVSAPVKAPGAQRAPEASQSAAPAKQRSKEVTTATIQREPIGAVDGASGRGARAADQALKMVGKPYRYGGSNPSSGFDCSGLIQFSFRQVGIVVPRSTEEQRRFSQKIPVSNLRQGDLLFFDQGWTKNSHAGIYIGDGKFVHAPSSGKSVRVDKLDAPYWRKHLSETRRVERLKGG